MAVKNVLGQVPKGAENGGAEATLAFLAYIRCCAKQHVFLEQRFDAEAFEAVGTVEGPFSAVDSAMFNQSDRFLKSSIANFALVRRILRVCPLVLKQAGRLVEYLATDFANVLDLSGVDILVPAEGTEQRVGVSTKATFVALHSIDYDDLGRNPLGFHFRCGHLVSFLFLGMCPLVSLADNYGYESFIAVDAFDGLLRFLVRS